jgi:uncharacterized protein
MKFLQLLYILLGTISLLLGLIGIVVPGLPTTPFLLLTAWFYLRGSDKLYNKLMDNKHLGKYIKDFRSGKGLTKGFKLGSLILMTLMVTTSCVFFLEQTWLKLVVVGAALIGVYVMIFALPTRKNNTDETKPND